MANNLRFFLITMSLHYVTRKLKTQSLAEDEAEVVEGAAASNLNEAGDDQKVT